MQKELNRELSKMSDVDFHELRIRPDFAEEVRKLEGKRYMQEKETIAEKIGISVNQLEKAKRAAFDLSLMNIASIVAFKNELDFEIITKQNEIKVSAEKTKE